MRRALTLAFSIPLAFAASCGDNGKTCTIHTAGDVKTLTCPDGTSTTITGSTGTGTTGESGKDTLVSVTDEPAGANCEFGGKAIATGVDTNGDGVLQTSEIQSTSYVCVTMGPTPDTVTGDVTVSNSIEYASLTGVKTITGRLTVNASTGVTAITLPTVTHVGSFTLNDGTTSSGPFLAAPPGSPAQPQGEGPPPSSNGTLVSFSAPALTTIDHEVDITDYGDTPTLTTLDLSALTTTDSLRIDGTALTSLSGLSHLTTLTTGIYLQGTSLTSLSGTPVFSSFKGQIVANNNNALVDTTALSTVKSAASVDIESNNAMVTLDFSSFTGASSTSFYLQNNAALTTFKAPLFTMAGYLNISNNSSYPECLAEAILAQISPAPGASVSGNSADTTNCPPAP